MLSALCIYVARTYLNCMLTVVPDSILPEDVGKSARWPKNIRQEQLPSMDLAP